MKKIILTMLIFLFSSVCLLAKDYINPLSMYGNNYICAGDVEDQVQFRFGVKVNMWYQTGIYFGYTQDTWWEVYNNADTMSANYMPEVFYKIESKNNDFNNVDLGLIDYIQISPWQHRSTGREGIEHRSINIAYVKLQVSYGDRINVGDNIKVWFYETQAEENLDIEKYKGYFENDVFIKLMSDSVKDMSIAELHFKHGNTLSNFWIEPEFRIRLIGTDLQTKFFVKWFYGKGGSDIVYYNKLRNELRVGVIF